MKTIILFATALFIGLFANNCQAQKGKKKDQVSFGANKQEEKAIAEEQKFFKENAKKQGVKVLSNGVQYEVLVQGEGDMPALSDKVRTHYHGTLLNGKVFDSSVERKQSASFPLNGVIKGWQDALQLMRVGSKWRLYIPYELAYGADGAGSIPPYATLIFEVELLEIIK